jgi:hypothetical protein
MTALADHFDAQAQRLDQSDPPSRTAKPSSARDPKMNRIVHLNLDEGVVEIRCMSEDVEVCVIERLPTGGVRLVCMNDEGAALIRRKLKDYVIDARVKRERQPPNSQR